MKPYWQEVEEKTKEIYEPMYKELVKRKQGEFIDAFMITYLSWPGLKKWDSMSWYEKVKLIKNRKDLRIIAQVVNILAEAENEV